jgi:hypothetical protein
MEQVRINQASRVLDILQDGEWHSALDFAQLSRPILSWTRRIFELRQAGHVIERERRNGIWKYKLLSAR